MMNENKGWFMMNDKIMKCCIVASSIFVATLASARVITVSPDGMSPNEAIDLIRSEKNSGNKEAWVINVKKGMYSLSKPLVICPSDSGTKDCLVSWEGEDGAIFSGGQEIKNWRKSADEIWVAAIPKDRNGNVIYFDQLWINGRRANRSRFPSAGYFIPHTGEQVERNENGSVFYDGIFSFTNGCVKPLLGMSKDEIPFAQVAFHHKWNFMRYTLADVYEKNDSLFVKTIELRNRWSRWARVNEKESLCYFENVRCGFDEPGEWFYDAKAGLVMYRPLKGEKLESISAIAPVSGIGELIQFKGDVENTNAVEYISFKNIAFMHSASQNGMSGPCQMLSRQAAGNMTGTIIGRGMKHIVFDGCKIAHTGNYGMRFTDACVSNKILNCEFNDLGAGGIWLGSNASRPMLGEGEVVSRKILKNDGPFATSFNEIDNCHIFNGGKYNASGTGIVVAHASDTRVTHCEIHDLYYTGISVGWSWGYGGSVAQRNEIAYNKIYDIGKNELSDMGGVYTLGTSFGTHVHDNVIYDVHSYMYGGWGLYTDEGSEGIILENNLVYDTEDGCFHQHFGVGNTVRNNIFAFNEKQGVLRSTAVVARDVPSSLNVLNNIIVTKAGPLLSVPAMKVSGAYAGNLWYVYGDGDVEMGTCKSWQEWEQSGREFGGKFADPEFTDADKKDFTLKETSPALKLGFKPFDFSQAGLRNND